MSLKHQQIDLLVPKKSFFVRLLDDLVKNKTLYLLIIPVLLYYIIFRIVPIYGASIAFKDFMPMKGIEGSPWVGLKHFTKFFESYYFWRVLSNTFTLSFLQILFGFPIPILFAIMMNEIRSSIYRKTIQTITYLPHFISLVVICGMITQFSSTNGIFNDILVLFNINRVPLLQKPEFFRGIYILSEIWQKFGWESIIYLAALMGIDGSLYEAAAIDGANRFKRIWHVTLPGLAPTIVVMLILRIGRVMEIGFEKIILLYNPATYEVADVISSYVYRIGLNDFNWSYAASVGLFNSVINVMFLVVANRLSKRYSGSYLW